MKSPHFPAVDRDLHAMLKIMQICSRDVDLCQSIASYGYSITEFVMIWISADRVMVLRTASDFDQQYPGQDMEDCVRNITVAVSPAIENAYRVGSAVANYIIEHWWF